MADITKANEKIDAWERNLERLKSGEFGEPYAEATLLKYWRAQADADYPHANENVNYYENNTRDKLVAMIKYGRNCFMEDDDYDDLNEYLADRLLAGGVVVPSCLCENCQFYTPFEKVEDFDGYCRARDCETDKYEYCSYATKRRNE